MAKANHTESETRSPGESPTPIEVIDSRRRGVLSALVRNWKWISIVVACLSAGGVGGLVWANVAKTSEREAALNAAIEAHANSEHKSTVSEVRALDKRLVWVEAQHAMMVQQLGYLGDRVQEIGMRLGTNPPPPPPMMMSPAPSPDAQPANE